MAKLRFAVRKFDPFERALADCWAKYQAFAPADMSIEFVPMDLEELHDDLFVKEGLRNGSWDIAHINTDWMAEAYETNSVEALNEFITRKPPEGGIQAWSPSLMGLQQFDEKLYGFPFHDGPECLVIRKDLFESPQEQALFFERYRLELKVPQTWDDFLRVSEFFHRPDQRLYGTVFAGYPDGHNAVFDFCIQLWARGGELTNAKGELYLETSQAVEALDFYRAFFRSDFAVHPQSQVYESVQAGQAFARGEVAMMVNWFGFASWAHIDKESKTRGKVDIAPIPTCAGGTAPSLNVYWLYSLASGSQHKGIAYDFLCFAVNATNDKNLTLAGGVGCRQTTWSDPEVNAQIPFYAKLAQLHETARTLPRQSNWASVAHCIDNMVNEAVQTDIPSQLLLQKTQKEIDVLL
ncbi:extracellular solute-binding protein [Sphingobacterium sp. LRF_L2]|uniref:extracellular solute-binding protein n=1 Tax=Sphingobacterium sp. LRF_L2 TaxID=3369421 RepID=UPI003F6173D7